MKKILLMLSASILFSFSACKTAKTDKSNTPVKIAFTGNYLIEGIELFNDESGIKSVILSKNNLSELGIKEKEVIKSLSLYEAQVIWDMNNRNLCLDKGYNIGQENIAFSNPYLILNRSIDTGDISFSIMDSNWKFEDNKIYNFSCTYSNIEYDSYFRYEEGKLLQVTVDDLEYNQVNCVYDDDSLYLASFLNMDSDGNPIYECYGELLAYRTDSAIVTDSKNNQEVSLADSCEYLIASGTDKNGDCYQLVGEDRESYEGSNIYMGIIKNNEWLIEMTSDVPFLDDNKDIYKYMRTDGEYVFSGMATLKNAIHNTDGYSLTDRIGYISNGCFYLLGKRNGKSQIMETARTINNMIDTVVFWNGETNKSKVINNITLQYMEDYVNGNDVIISELTDYNFSLSNDFFADIDIKLLNPKTLETKTMLSQTLNNKPNNDTVNNVKQIGDGLFYANNAFYDTSGNKAFDLNEHYGEFSRFEDGKLEVIRRIATGTQYRVLMDKTGKVIYNEKIE